MLETKNAGEQKNMKYTKENIKYCLLAHPDWIRQSYGIPPTVKPPYKWSNLPRIMHSGLTQWGKVFKGDYDLPNVETVENYNVIHVNYTPSNAGKVKYLKKIIDGRDIKIVINVDHAIDLWGANGFVEINQMIDEINLADHIFGVESTMCDSLSVLIGRHVHCIPHPTDIEMIQKNFKKREGKDEEFAITVFFHTYDKNWLLITNLIILLKEDHNIIASAVGATDGFPAAFRNAFDMNYNRVSFSDAMKIIALSDVVIDTAVTHSYGRVPIECSALGVPCIGDSKIESIRKLHNYGMVDIFNIMEIEQVIYNEKVPSDCSEYGYDRSAEKFLSMLNSGADNE